MVKKLAYVMSRFPKVTETFVLFEILELKAQGVDVEIFPLVRERENVMHAEAEKLVAQAHYPRYLSLAMLAAHLHFLTSSPLKYLQIWWEVITGSIRSPKFLSRALVNIPASVLFSHQMKKLGIQHVHAHFASHAALTAYIIHKLTGIPYSFTAHAHDIYVNQTMLREKTEAAAFVVAISDYNRRFMAKLYGDDLAQKIRVVHCGIDTAMFDMRPFKEAEKFTIICVGSLMEYKGQKYLIEACAQLKAQGLDFQCWFVGEGPDRPELEALIQQLGLGQHVTLYGRQPRQKVKELLNAADVMVLASVVTKTGKKEGIPVALMEAMATGLPVISTQISGIPELIDSGYNGLLVPERDATALKDAIVKMHDDALMRKEFGIRGREKVIKEFNLPDNVQQLAKLFMSPLDALPIKEASLQKLSADS